MAYALPSRADTQHVQTQDTATIRKWSPAQTLVFIIVTCAGSWAVAAGLIVGALAR